MFVYSLALAIVAKYMGLKVEEAKQKYIRGKWDILNVVGFVS